MGRIETRLMELGLTLPTPLKLPSANRTAGKIIGSMLYISGHGSDLLEGTNVCQHGRVPDEVKPADAYETARAVGLKMLATVRDVTGDLDRIEQVVNLKGYVYSTPEFDAMNAVINGASDLLYDVFGDPSGVHTRSTIGVAALVKRQTIEIDAVFQLND